MTTTTRIVPAIVAVLFALAVALGLAATTQHGTAQVHAKTVCYKGERGWVCQKVP